jgi:orotate phosphoribosyltransferase
MKQEKPINFEQMKNNLFKRLKEIGAVKKLEEAKKLKSGEYSHWFFDVKLAYADPESIELIEDLLVSLIPKNITCIALDEGSHSLGALLAKRTRLKICYLRCDNTDKNKPMFKGYRPTEKDIICFIDDVYTKGTAFFIANRLMNQQFSRFASYFITIIDRGEQYLESTPNKSVIYAPYFIPELLTENII